jgi:uncharacterized protein (TIGR03437 family)
MLREVILLALVPAALAQTLRFGTPGVYKAGRGPLAIVTGDLNADGKADIAVADAGSPDISIYLNNGEGTFRVGQPVSLPSDCSLGYLAIGSFTRKGAADLLGVCTLSDLTMVVVPNLGQGQFGAPVRVVIPSSAYEAWTGNYVFLQLQPAVADFNGDGWTDLVLSTVDPNTLNSSNNNSNPPVLGWYFLPGNGGGTFGAPVPINLGSAGNGGVFLALSSAAGDFNGDGKLDLFVAAAVSANTATGGAVQFFSAAGFGDGRFAPLSPVSVAVGNLPGFGTLLIPADVNGDGKLDMLITGSSLLGDLLLYGDTGGNANVAGLSDVVVLLGDGAGHFTQKYGVALPSFMAGAAVGNFLGSGKLDLAVATMSGDFLLSAVPTGGFEVLPGVGDGTFGAPVAFPVPSGDVATGVATADFNGDGKTDLAFAEFPAISIQSVGNATNGLFAGTGAVLTSVLASLPEGSVEVLLNATTGAMPTFTDANGASFANGPQAVDAIVSAFGTGLAAGKAGASSLPLPTTLGGVTIEVKDAAGVTRQAPLLYVSPGQINYAIPDGTAVGTATVTIQSGTGTFAAQQEIVSVAPGIFNANGFAVGTAVKTVNGAQQSTAIYANGAGQPIDVSGGGTFLVLYGTGIRNHASAVTATVGTVADLPVAYAGAQGTFFGEDQLNIQLPASLAGAGTVSVTVTMDGQVSNAVKIQVK